MDVQLHAFQIGKEITCLHHSHKWKNDVLFWNFYCNDLWSLIMITWKSSFQHPVPFDFVLIGDIMCAHTRHMLISFSCPWCLFNSCCLNMLYSTFHNSKILLLKTWVYDITTLSTIHHYLWFFHVINNFP